MKITYFDNYEKLSEGASNLFIQELTIKKNLLACCATGGSPSGFYERLVQRHDRDHNLFDQLQILKLDEWGGISMSDPSSCQSYLKEKVLTPLHISGQRYIEFNSEADNVNDECQRIQQTIDQIGPIDICILGLGKNGHLGFNEPADFLQRDCHIAKLATSTVQHNMVQTMNKIPTFGMTVGLKDILNSKKILLLVTGTGKQEAIKKLMTKEITTQLPASFLWLHPNVECLIDKAIL